MSNSEQRIEICNTCDKLKIVFTTKICSACGCVLAAKVLLPNATCPMNKWVNDGSKE
jgi:hypothetical protein